MEENFDEIINKLDLSSNEDEYSITVTSGFKIINTENFNQFSQLLKKESQNQKLELLKYDGLKLDGLYSGTQIFILLGYFNLDNDRSKNIS
jgi:hypothetical protein